MVKHIVLYRLKDRTEENAEKLRDKFLSMRGKIDVLYSIESGIDVLKTDRSYDVALICQFKTLKDYAIYRDHPVHLPVKEYAQSVVEVSKSVDYIE